MPRIGRVVLPNHPHHVVQRGHNRQVVFAETADFEHYLSDLRELKEAFDVRVKGTDLFFHQRALQQNHNRQAPFANARDL